MGGWTFPMMTAATVHIGSHSGPHMQRPADKTLVFFRRGGQGRIELIPLAECWLNHSGARERSCTVYLLFICVLQHQNRVVDFQGGS